MPVQFVQFQCVLFNYRSWSGCVDVVDVCVTETELEIDRSYVCVCVYGVITNSSRLFSSSGR